MEDTNIQGISRAESGIKVKYIQYSVRFWMRKAKKQIPINMKVHLGGSNPDLNQTTLNVI